MARKKATKVASTAKKANPAVALKARLTALTAELKQVNADLNETNKRLKTLTA